jgi:plastocyanin
MRPLIVAAGLVALGAAPLHAQSLLYRSPNWSGTWVADPGVVQFNFIHRFYVSPSPSRAFVNFPTFTFAAGVGHEVGLGYRFATRSTIPGGSQSSASNESELFARWRFWGGHEGSEGLAAAVTPAWNFRASSFDAEVAADYTKGPFTLLGAVRELSKAFGGSSAQTALAAGVVVRLNQYLAFTGDIAKPLGGDTTAAWSAGIQVLIPGSPHSFALEVSNAASNTYQGSSRGLPPSGVARRLYGFEFTIPLHLSRFAAWFHPSRGPALGASGPAAADVQVAALKYSSDTVRITVGQIVRWTNHDPLDHTITFDVEGLPSGALPAKGSYAVQFDRTGTYPYHCTPHPFMTGVVIVQ